MLTEPLLVGKMPIKDFISVVLPIPLRPMIATISLGATETLRPCNTSLWP
jgi:hypothetical protein